MATLYYKSTHSPTLKVLIFIHSHIHTHHSPNTLKVQSFFTVIHYKTKTLNHTAPSPASRDFDEIVLVPRGFGSSVPLVALPAVHTASF